jgi:bacterioferritin-associated ferredoxin
MLLAFSRALPYGSQPLGILLLRAMIVCSCNVLTDKDVRTACAAAKARPRTTGQVYGCLGCSAQCGRCGRTIRRIMDQALIAAAQGCPAGCDCCKRS